MDEFHRVDMFCGSCDSNLSIESDQGESVWLMAFRFANAHTGCGYMVPSDGDGAAEPVKTRVIKPRRRDDEE